MLERDLEISRDPSRRGDEVSLDLRSRRMARRKTLKRMRYYLVGKDVETRWGHIGAL